MEAHLDGTIETTAEALADAVVEAAR